MAARLDARPVVGEADGGENFGDPIHCRRRAGLRRKAERVFKDFTNAYVGAGTDPLFDGLLPGIELEAGRLFRGGESFQSGRLQPPFRARVKADDCFRPELITFARQSIDVDHAVTYRRPVTPRTGCINQVAADDRIDGAGEHA